MFGPLETLFTSQPRVLGIDISNAAIKLIELSKSGQSYRVDGYGVVPMVEGAVVDKHIKNSSEVSEMLARLVKYARTSNTHVAVALPDSFVFTKIIQMEAGLEDEDIESQIMIDADKYIPYPLHEVSLDFSIIGPNATDDKLVDVLLIASRAEYIHTLTEVMEDAGLTLNVVDVQSYALERACKLLEKQLPKIGDDECLALIDIGATTTTLNILQNMKTVFSREEKFGGEQLTKEIQEKYCQSHSEAGLAKKKGGLPDDYETEVLQPFKEKAVLQARRSLQFFFSASPQSKVTHIVLSGGTMSIPGLPEMISEQLGIEATLANPFADMQIARRVNRDALFIDAPAMMACCGLAMRSFPHD